MAALPSVAAEDEEDRKRDRDVHRRPGERHDEFLVGFSGMRSRLATPPIGQSVTSGVRMP